MLGICSEDQARGDGREGRWRSETGREAARAAWSDFEARSLLRRDERRDEAAEATEE